MNYAALAATSDKLLTNNGQEITVSQYTPTRNPATGAVTKGAATRMGTAYAVEVPVTQVLLDAFALRLADAALVQKTVRAFKVSPALGFQPVPQDTITLSDGSVWPVVGCTPANPAGTPLVYTVGVAQ
jgi:hypothetical protein